MNPGTRAALLLHVVEALRARGSWAGESHVQKAVYLLQEVAGVPCGFPFVLYKHGPFSFPLRDELGALRAQGCLCLEPQLPPYGPRWAVAPEGAGLRSRHRAALAPYGPAVDWIAARLGDRSAGELEALATAHWVLAKAGPEGGSGSDAALLDALLRIKPHLSEGTASRALQEVREMMEEAHRRAGAAPRA